MMEVPSNTRQIIAKTCKVKLSLFPTVCFFPYGAARFVLHVALSIERRKLEDKFTLHFYF